MSDPTENIRRIEQIAINNLPDEELPEQTWTTSEVTAEFDILGFMAPYVTARRKSDDKLGSLQFRHSPRVYFNWQED